MATEKEVFRAGGISAEIKTETEHSYKVDKDTGKVLPVLADKDNNVIDSLRYSCEGIRRAVKKDTIKIIPLPTQNKW